MAISKIDLELDEMGRGHLFIDGVEMSGIVSAIVINAKAQKMTEVTLTINAARIRFTGRATVTTVQDIAAEIVD